MALPSFSHVWSSRQSESSSSKEEKFFLLGQGSGSQSQTVKVFRRNPNIRWFDQSYSFSPFSCCDKPFDTEEQLQEHKNSHIKCLTPDCEFTAHPDLLEKHFQLQHFNNLYRSICLTNKPEDVAKWINDRKRNFPTKTRVQTKQEEMEKRQARGQVIEKKQFGLMRGGYRGRRGSFYGSRGQSRPPRGQYRGRGRFPRGGRPFVAGQTEPAPERPLEEPMACLDSGEAKDSSDDDRPVEMSSKRPPGGLSLIADYDSDEEEEATPDVLPASDPRPAPDAQPNVDYRRRDPVLRLMRRREHCMEDKRRLLSRPRLLEMLLARDVQHERNVLMQCCFFIAKRDFFGRCQGKGGDDPATTEAAAKSSPRALEDEEKWDDGVL